MTSERANAYERNYIWNFVLVQIVDHVAGKLLKVRGSRRTFFILCRSINRISARVQWQLTAEAKARDWSVCWSDNTEVRACYY